MKRLLPRPFTTGALFLLWLLINQSLSPGNLFLALVLAVGIPLLTSPLQPLPDPRPVRPLVLFRLLSFALVEIIRSCFNVSRIILFVKPDKVKSQFMRIPLDLENPYGLAMLSCLINTTPGTVWVEILPGSRELALHVFDLHDEQWWVDTIKTRYEKPLIDIFEGGSPA